MLKSHTLKTRYIIIGLLAGLLLAIGFYFHYQRKLHKQALDTWSFVPGSALVVYESKNIWEDWHELEEKPIWSILSSIPFFQNIAEQVTLLDSAASDDMSLENFFTNKPFLISTHVTSKDALDYLFYFPIQGARQHALIQDILKEFKEESHITDNKRIYNGYNIFELKDTQNDTYFSYIIYQNFFVGSFTPLLVEDVIRNIDPEKDNSNFQSLNSAVFSTPEWNNNEGKIYANTSKLPLLFSTFASNENAASLQGIGALCSAMSMDVTFNDQYVLLNGFSTSEVAAKLPAEEISLLETFSGQAPATMSIQNYVPEETALLYHFTFSDPLLWQDKLYTYLKQDGRQEAQLSFLQTKNTADPSYNISPTDIFSWFQGEIGLSVLESVDINNPDLLLIINVADTTDALHTLQALDAEAHNQPNQEMYEELFGDNTIRELEYEEFPAHTLGPLFSGFEQCFFTFTDHYLLMANDINALKRILLGRSLENTWGKSVKQSVFLESTLEKANFSLFINTSRAWEMLRANLSPKWRQFAETYAPQVRAFEQAAVQFSNTDEQFYTSIALKYKPGENQSPARSQYATVQQKTIENSLNSKPFVVRSHTHQNFETLVQDADNQLYLLSSDGDILWKDSLSDPIISEVQQLDFYNNGKLQYFFATADAIHIIDRNGDYVEGYPLNMPESVKIEWLSLVDYDNSKRYRFLVADTQGNLYMFNKEKENLEGWTPLALEGRLTSAPFHVRVRGKDFIIAVQESGKINVLSRRGENYSKFPLALNDKVFSQLFVKPGADPEKTQLSVLSEKGEITVFNLMGDVISKEQLYRPSTETSFRLCVDGLGKTYIIARQDFNKLSILNKNGSLVFEKNYISQGALHDGLLKVQYYDFGAGNEIYAVTDKVQEFTYLYNGAGELFNNRPVESGFEIGLLYFAQENKFQIYRNYEKDFSVISLPN